MQRLVKKQISCIVAMVMVLLLAMSVIVPDKTYAATSHSLKINNGGKTEHTFEIYQVFKGDLSGKVLSNIQWGSGIKDSSKAGLGSASAKAKTLTNVTKAEEFANDIQSHLGTPVKTQKVAAGGSETVTGLAPGYYLVKDTASTQNKENGAYTSYILKIVADTETSAKLDVPTVVKKVQENSDKVWQDAADYNIGDTIPYKLTGTLPTNYDKYTKYAYKFHDEMSAGLTLDPASIKVKIDGTEIASSKYTVTQDAGSNSFTVAFADLKTLDTPTTSNSTIVVEYNCKLNSNAVIGAQGNPNTVYLEYSNNPNRGGEGDFGKTPKDKNIVFSYKVIVNKKDENNDPLVGAEFTLYKKTATGKEAITRFTIDNTMAANKTTFTYNGLDAGKYVLEETKTPAGYNSIDPIEFTIKAEYDKVSDDPKLTKLVSLGVLTFTADKNAGSLSADVVNNKGFTLPETGGMGRALIYVLGTVLVIGSLGYMRRRKGATIK